MFVLAPELPDQVLLPVYQYVCDPEIYMLQGDTDQKNVMTRMNMTLRHINRYMTYGVSKQTSAHTWYASAMIGYKEVRPVSSMK